MQTTTIQCPYCWQSIEIVIDDSIPRQEYIEDCEVCCRSMRLVVSAEPDGEARVEAFTEDE